MMTNIYLVLLLLAAYLSGVAAGAGYDWIKWYRRTRRPELMMCVVAAAGIFVWHLVWPMHWFIKPCVAHWGDQFKDL